MLARLRAGEVVLRSGINERNAPRNARVVSCTDNVVSLQVSEFDSVLSPQIFLNFSLDGHEYFFAASPVSNPSQDLLEIEMPTTIYRAERRDLFRECPDLDAANHSTVQVLRPNLPSIPGRLIDSSLHGLGVDIREEDAEDLPREFQIHLDRATSRSQRLFAQVRHMGASSAARGWIRLGLSVSNVERKSLVQVDRRERILDRSLVSEMRRQRKSPMTKILEENRTASNTKLARSARSVPIVEYKNNKGQRIRAIVDSWGDPHGATAIIIPPSWGRTKETLLPLAATIVETFRHADSPVTVIRFDGSNRRGESHIDPECRVPGDEYLHFRFSQAVSDIETTIDFLRSRPKAMPSAIILVTFSLASVEGRRVVSENTTQRIDGWISVVGMADLQSALRTISGGMDYAYGLMKGVSFGLQELVGVVADMDLTGSDAINSGMVFLEDARLDMAAINVPITWIHGRHDAWMDIKKIQEIMSCGNTQNRKIIEVPTGHQLRESREALQTFQLIAEEISEMAIGDRFGGKLPPLWLLEERATAERQRIPATSVDIRAFWRDYLLGRDRVLGMEMLTATSAYRSFMARQIVHLSLSRECRVADLGCGTGAFLAELIACGDDLSDIHVYAVDYVIETLDRLRGGVGEAARSLGISASAVLADLDSDEFNLIPLSNGSCDAILASLLVTYLSRPENFLREAFRILKPGGTLVVSGLKKDADISRLYVDGVAELRTEEGRKRLGREAAANFDLLTQNFLNDASKLLDYEERGRFRFWDTSGLQDLISKAGFSVLSDEFAFGNPPQAIVVAARKP